MSNLMRLNLATEDRLSEVTLRRILAGFGDRFTVANAYSRGGFGYLKNRIRGFNDASAITPFLMLTDLDTSTCAPALISSWLPCAKHPNFLFRVAVREVESWLLADGSGIAKFLGVAETVIPKRPDDLPDPKRELIAIAKRSRKRDVRESIVPSIGTSAQQGPDYNGVLGQFVSHQWDPELARQRSLSLDRTIECLARFKQI